MGKSGLRVSAFSLGGWLTLGGSVESREGHRILDTALARGINSIDLADVYSNGEAERFVGRVLRARRRQDLVVASKVYFPSGPGPNDRGLSRKHIVESCEASLRRLGTDYLDLYYCHREDPETPLEETLRAMDDLVRQGKILYWGTSLWSPKTLLKTHALAGMRNQLAPVVDQPEYSLLRRDVEKRLVPVTRKLGMGIVAFSPLANGTLTGKYLAEPVKPDATGRTHFAAGYLTPDTRQRLGRFVALARSLDATPAQLALAWLVRRKGVDSVILGASRASQLEENLGALELELDETIAKELDGLFPR